ncbi:hypothetical protein A4G99_20340 [Haladaptatus sp. R4]|nr:hypothetical protein [Haladaptatus sp. R4]KZN26413.1 hypothetical protein A4G99_20340 [Haladaptatus sp. R4]
MEEQPGRFDQRPENGERRREKHRGVRDDARGDTPHDEDSDQRDERTGDFLASRFDHRPSRDERLAERVGPVAHPDATFGPDDHAEEGQRTDGEHTQIREQKRGLKQACRLQQFEADTLRRGEKFGDEDALDGERRGDFHPGEHLRKCVRKSNRQQQSPFRCINDSPEVEVGFWHRPESVERRHRHREEGQQCHDTDPSGERRAEGEDEEGCEHDQRHDANRENRRVQHGAKSAGERHYRRERYSASHADQPSQQDFRPGVDDLRIHRPGVSDKRDPDSAR